jgi:hypothetical protein
MKNRLNNAKNNHMEVSTQQHDIITDMKIKKRPYTPPILSKLEALESASGISRLQETDVSGFVGS